MHWLSRDVEFFSEPGGGEHVGSSGDYETAAVVERTTVNGLEWIRVQTGMVAPGHFVSHGWAPGRIARLGQTYEPFFPECPNREPTLVDAGGMPLHALSCLGSKTLTFSAVQVRNEGSELAHMVQGQPYWLAEGTGLVAHWFPEWRELGAIDVYVDPESDVHVPLQSWVELTGQLDHAAAQSCSISSYTSEHFHISTTAEAVLLCRGRFVVTGVRALSEAEIPPRPPQGTPGPEPGARLEVAVREFDGPFSTRIDPPAVWTGTEMIVWGGSDWTKDWNSTARSEGAAYSPSDRTWRRIPDGPLSPRAGSAAAWTGTEMLVWGGYNDDGSGLTDGAAYDPFEDRWRPISPGPLRSSFEIASVWTGSEWWVAVEGGGVDVAAYDPASDKWRPLPSIRHELYREGQLFWTGTTALFMDTEGGVFSITPTGDRWTSEPTDFHGPAAWTGDLLVGTRYETVINEPFNTDQWWYPVGWDPVARQQVELARPPHSAGDPIWTGDRLLYFDYGLAFDPASAEWLNLDLDKDPPKHGFRRDAATVWADDRLIVWGGWSACPGWVAGYDTGYELIPEASSVALARLAKAQVAPQATAVPPPRYFAC